jgi:phenylacetate-CoA ligase
MLVVRGVNVFPSAVENVVRQTVGGAEFRVVIDPALADPTTGYPTALRLQVEAVDAPELPGRLAAAIRAELQVRAVVEIVPPGALPRTTHKARRVVRANEPEVAHRVP